MSVNAMLSQSKAAFFAELSGLNESSDEDAKTKAGKTQQPPSSITVAQSPKVPTIARTQSEPIKLVPFGQEEPNSTAHLTLSGHTTSSASTVDSRRLDLSQDAKRPDLERRTISNPTSNSLVLKPSAGVMSMLGKKRKRNEPGKAVPATKRKTSLKRNESIQLLPDEYQIFRNFTFFYVPNDDNNPLRRLRITKAREHGARWAKDQGTVWGSSVTHIVVDTGITYQDAVKYISKAFIAPDKVVMVNDEYPIKCCEMRLVLDPNQDKYRVPGYPDAKRGAQSTEREQQASEQSEGSLKIKKSKQLDVDVVKETPLQSNDSTQVIQGSHPPELPRSESSPGMWLNTSRVVEAAPLVESPQDKPETPPEPALSRNPTKEKDALDEMITIAQKAQHLPLDSDDEDRPSSRDEPEDSGDSGSDKGPTKPRFGPKKRLKGGPKGAFKQENFTCMKGGTGATDNASPNDGTIKILQEMSDFYERSGDKWRPRAYRMAIGTLRKQSSQITTAEEAFSLPFIGERFAQKMEEIVHTSNLRQLKYVKEEPTFQILQLFMDIYGVSTSHASSWVSQGYRTLEDLKNHVNLTPNQSIGIEHYDDFRTRIPREEVTALGKIVEEAARVIDPEVQVIIGGSYRRGAKTSGDIDVLLTKPGTSTSFELLPFLLSLQQYLESSNFLVRTLAAPHSDTGTKWHGCCVLPSSSPPIWRRIDLLIVPAKELGAALIYFTGDDIFNRSIRLLASRKGMRLNQRGLYKDVLRGLGRVKMNEGALVEGENERGIFERLGVPWREPSNRICQ